MFSISILNTHGQNYAFFNNDLKLITALTVHRIPFDMNGMAESDPVKFYHIFIFPNYLSYHFWVSLTFYTIFLPLYISLNNFLTYIFLKP